MCRQSRVLRARSIVFVLSFFLSLFRAAVKSTSNRGRKKEERVYKRTIHAIGSNLVLGDDI
jgi:hypothetical protein